LRRNQFGRLYIPEYATEFKVGDSSLIDPVIGRDVCVSISSQDSSLDYGDFGD
jgi:hypothetical protein